MSAHSDRREIIEMSPNIVTAWENKSLKHALLLHFFQKRLICFQALPGNHVPLLIRWLTADPYLACFWWLTDDSTIQPFTPQSSSLNFDSIGLFNFPVNASNVFLDTFLSSDYTGEPWDGSKMKSSWNINTAVSFKQQCVSLQRKPN